MTFSDSRNEDERKIYMVLVKISIELRRMLLKMDAGILRAVMEGSTDGYKVIFKDWGFRIISAWLGSLSVRIKGDHSETLP